MNDEKGKEVMIQDQGEWGRNNGMCWMELRRSQHKSDPGEKSAREIGRRESCDHWGLYELRRVLLRTPGSRLARGSL